MHVDMHAYTHFHTCTKVARALHKVEFTLPGLLFNSTREHKWKFDEGGQLEQDVGIANLVDGALN